MDGHLSLRYKVERMSFLFQALMGRGHRGPSGAQHPEGGRGLQHRGDDDRLTFNELRDVLPDEGDTLAVRVSPDGADLALKLFGASDDIFGERIFCQLSKSWPLQQCRNLLQENIYIQNRAGGAKGQQGQHIIEQAPNDAHPLTWRLNVIGG